MERENLNHSPKPISGQVENIVACKINEIKILIIRILNFALRNHDLEASLEGRRV